MKISIIQEDNMVGCDGLFFVVDLSDMDTSIHAIQYDTVEGYGHIEYDAYDDNRRPNQQITEKDFKKFNKYIKTWNVKKKEYDEEQKRYEEKIKARKVDE